MSVQPLVLPDIAPVTIKPVTRGDVPRLLALCAEHAESIAHQRLADGEALPGTLELMEALFDAPRRAWAWIAESGGDAVGYISATVDFSMLERGYYVNVDAPFVQRAWQHRNVDQRLFQQALALAADTGCLYAQLQMPSWMGDASRLQNVPTARRIEMVRYVFPVAADASCEPPMAMASQTAR